MSEIDPLGARLAIQNAQFALQKKQFVEARRLAMEAIQLDPNFEDPWLILATLSSPNASVAYLKRALEINPNSQRATKGMQWALERLSKATNRDEVYRKSSATTQPVAQSPQPPQPSKVTVVPPPLPPQPSGEFLTNAERYAAFREGEQKSKEITQPIKIKTGRQGGKAVTRGRKGSGASIITAVLLILLFLAAAAAIIWYALPIWAALANSSSAPLPADVLEKPSLTPTSTATPTPTATATPTPTPTNTPTPLPTETPLPTNTPLPLPTQAVVYEPPPVVSSGNSGRWIDVDLTNQMLYAYDGDTLVNSFLVSTGVAAHPTVTGQYHIYVKYVSTLMTGPGYYLPDVPYTMYFYEGYGIHGTYWHNNFGHPMSHGCVNMRTADAEWMFNWASIGTLVNVHY